MDLKATSATVLAVKLQERRRRSGASNIGIEDAQVMVNQGCSGAGTRGNGVPTLFWV